MKASKLVDRAVRALKASPAIDHWQKDREVIEAEDLLGHVMGGEEPHPDDEIPAAKRRRFERLVARRCTGEPIPYIKGYSEFRGLRLVARPGVFVPRDSTEFLAGQAIRRLRGRWSPVAVDLATGGGPVALAVANEAKDAKVFGTDLSEEAVALARRNARRLGLSVRFTTGDLFAPLPGNIAGRVDAITLHPPYVARREMRELPEEIVRFEPRNTITDGSSNGLGLIERAAEEAVGWLRPGGWLLVEVSPDRSRSVAGVFRAQGLRDVRSTKDRTWGVTRVVVARR